MHIFTPATTASTNNNHVVPTEALIVIDWHNFFDTIVIFNSIHGNRKKK